MHNVMVIVQEISALNSKAQGRHWATTKGAHLLKAALGSSFEGREPELRMTLKGSLGGEQSLGMEEGVGGGGGYVPDSATKAQRQPAQIGSKFDVQDW